MVVADVMRRHQRTRAFALAFGDTTARGMLLPTLVLILL
jgi:hypothetical protein